MLIRLPRVSVRCSGTVRLLNVPLADAESPCETAVAETLPSGTPVAVRLPLASGKSVKDLVLSPALKQPFFIGDGRTSAGLPQRVIAPTNATRLFLGTMDTYDWWNNEGSFTVSVTNGVPVPLVASICVSQVEICWPSEPSRTYQVQYSTSASPSLWTNLGSPVPGNGSTECLQDAVLPSQPARFYRVLEN